MSNDCVLDVGGLFWGGLILKRCLAPAIDKTCVVGCNISGSFVWCVLAVLSIPCNESYPSFLSLSLPPPPYRRR